ncbi:PAS domain-containing protein [Alkalilimnicola ehrlichii]|uniref:DNA-directed DNA polymerase n=1 Tax=Alkalilimnicola ehrlichii TaxID=351052 RepID=A0A3E0X2E1_9GAMM|nr:PAS domain-containing protein [Alkalilimnicola ehrlichii]RFA38670.1 hypothetical protein CAL65_04900 [Alkalilimnicola ehrlichii]
MLRELDAAVLVCDNEGRILLYNPAAQRILAGHEALGLGRSLYDICARAPVEHTLELLQLRRDTDDGKAGSAEFVCATTGHGPLLHCRLSLLPAEDGGFVLGFENAGARIERLVRRDSALRHAVENLRSPLTNLRAAAETLSAGHAMDPVTQDTFLTMLERESQALSERFEGLVKVSQERLSSRWTMADIRSRDLIDSVLRHGLEQLPQLEQTGRPLWLHAESLSLGFLLGHLLQQLKSYGIPYVNVEALLGNRWVYLDIVWEGKPIPADTLSNWLSKPLAYGEGLTGNEVLERHDSEAWSQEHGREGYALLRLPLPASQRQWEHAGPDRLPPRPEFYDFSLSEQRAPLADLASTRLDDLHYVVFDTETTGLRPSEGDRIISLAAIRVVNGRILYNEAFERIVNPERKIPAASTRFHGITDADVNDAPTIGTVLPAFRNFVGDAVLVAHNAAFDMKFLQLQEANTGVRFDNPVLDTLLLSFYLHDHTPEHTLEAIAKRLGVKVEGRHTAAGDATTTAEIFVRLLELLRAHGIETLGQALGAAEEIVDVRRMQSRF